MHIGTHKTGSSAIQAAFTQHETEPPVLYPRTGRISSGGHLNLAWEALGDPRFRRGRGTTADLVREIRSCDPSMVVLSAETFSVRPGDPVIADWAARLADEFNPNRVVILGYVRPQWSYLESHYTQMVKIGATGDRFQQFVDREQKRPIFDYSLVFSTWLERFGDSLLVRPYPSDVVADFFAVANLRKPQISPRVNVRPGAKQIEMLKLLNGDLKAKGDERRKAFARAQEWLAARYPEDLPFKALTPSLLIQIADRFAETNQGLADRYWEGRLHPSFQPPADTDVSVWSLRDGLSLDHRNYATLLESARGWVTATEPPRP